MITEIYGQHYGCELSVEHIATIVRLEAPTAAGPEFYTEPGRPLQVGRLYYRKGHTVPTHRHKPRSREGVYGPTQEVLILRSGRLLCYFFDSKGQFAREWSARPGDVIIIHGGGHFFEALEDTDVIEVKQGPYDPHDKELLGDLHDGVLEQETGVAVVAQQEVPREQSSNE